MSDFIDPTVICAVKELIVSQTGIFFDDKHTRDLERHISTISREIGVPIEFWSQLLQDPVSANNLLETLITHITIGETYFFRDKNLFLYLKEHLLPNLIWKKRKKKRLFLRIWCAACSSGEEPYSLAILLRYLIPDITEWDVFLLATDINKKMLERAEMGEYSRWSFRDDPIIPIGQFFSPTPDNHVKIDPIIKKMVRFERMNLIRDTLFYQSLGSSSLDLIVCRNVLMYFSKEQSSFVLSRLIEILQEEGTLIVSPQEIGIINHPSVHLIHQGSVFLHVKSRIAYSEIPDHQQDIKEIIQNKNFEDPGVNEEFFESTTDQPDLIKYDKTVVEKTVKVLTTISEVELFEELISENKLDEAGDLLRKLSYGSGYGSLLKQIEILIKAYAGLGEYEKALGWSDRMIAEEMLNPRPYMLKAVVLDEIGQIDSSLHSLRQSLYADPDYLPAHLTIAGIYSRTGKTELARHHYSQSVKILENLPEEQVLLETEGIPAIKMKEMIQTLLRRD